jgi:hypothetical protein
MVAGKTVRGTKRAAKFIRDNRGDIERAVRFVHDHRQEIKRAARFIRDLWSKPD